MTKDGKKGEPLGLLIYKARLEKGLSRAELSRMTEISDNSLIRYEKAGVDQDGQYPPGPKLAKLCFSLDLDPQTALLACLDNDRDYWHFEGMAFNQVNSHPAVEWLEHQYTQALRDCNLMRRGLELLVPLTEDQQSTLSTKDKWFLSELQQCMSDHMDFTVAMLGQRFYNIQVSDDLRMPSDAADERNVDWATTLTRFRIEDEKRKKENISTKGVLERSWSQLFTEIATRLSDPDIKAIIDRLNTMLEAGNSARTMREKKRARDSRQTSPSS